MGLVEQTRSRAAKVRIYKASKGTLFRMLRHRSGQQVGSTLTTPPNSPEPELSSEFEYKYRREKAPKKPVFFRFEVIFGLVVSNLMTFVLGATLG